MSVVNQFDSNGSNPTLPLGTEGRTGTRGIIDVTDISTGRSGSSNSGPDSVISQMITNLISTSYNDPSLRQALAVLDKKMDENSAEKRRQLRSNIESSIIKSGSQILKDFSKLHQKLSTLGETIDDLNNQYDYMSKLVNQASRDTAQLYKESDELRKNDQAISVKTIILNSYQNNFVITPEEIDILNRGLVNDDNNMLFFQTLDKVKRIHKDCEALLTADETSSTGIEIMNTMSGYLDRGYEKVALAVEQEFKRMVTGQYMNISKSLREYLVILSENRPTLFDGAVNGLVNARQKNLTNDFIKALTIETTRGGISKPIDFYAYDVLRYVGDIMAWIHSAIVGEQEVLETLLLDDRQNIRNKVDKVTSTLVKPFRLRIEQVISGEDNVIIIYKVGNILNFYYSTFQKSLDGDTSSIMIAISRLEEASKRKFNDCLENKVSSLRDQLSTGNNNNSNSDAADSFATKFIPPSDLQPPEFLIDSLSDAKSILSSYEASISFTSNLSDEFRQIVHDLIEPYLELCNRISANLASIDSEIFLINCYDATKNTLVLFPFVSYKIDQMDTRINELADVLEDRQYQKFLISSGISNFKRRKDKNDTKPVVELASLLDNFLPAATMESGVLLHGLSSPRLASSITLRASQRLAEEFENLKGELNQRYGEEQIRLLLPRTVHEVRTLLALD